VAHINYSKKNNPRYGKFFPIFFTITDSCKKRFQIKENALSKIVLDNFPPSKK
jgi:hypothetical protein